MSNNILFLEGFVSAKLFSTEENFDLSSLVPSWMDKNKKFTVRKITGHKYYSILTK